MNKNISVTPEIDKQLTRLRKKYADDEGTKASYSRIIRKVMHKAKMWIEE